MQSPNLVRIVAAFVAGVVIALGSALIYVRATDLVLPQVAALPQAAETAAPVIVPRTLPLVQPELSVAAAASPAFALPSSPKPMPKPVSAKRPVAIRPATYNTPQPRNAKPLLATLKTSIVPVAKPVKYVVPQSDQPESDAPAPLAEMAPVDNAALAPEVVSPVTPAPRQPHTVTLNAGTPLLIRLAENLASDRNYVGDTFRATLVEPVISDGFVIADRGSKALGRITGTDHGQISLTLTEINTTDGQRVAVETATYARRAQYQTGQEVATIGGGAVLGAIIGGVAAGDKGAAIGAGVGGAAGTGVVLASRRRPAAVPIESLISFRLSVPLTLTEKLAY